MLDTSQAFGRPISAVLRVPDRSPEGPDKWSVLSDLTRAAEAFGVGHRTLSVLKALMTFLPGRALSTRRGPCVVFPANRTLSERLNGMPESTLRRHLAALVSAGLVSRRDSPNRKRYARRVGGEGGIAFGFDLSPLAQRQEEIEARALAARQAEEEHAVLRARLAELRAQILTCDPGNELAEPARKALRRKNNTAELADLVHSMEDWLATETGAADSQNERHIQNTEKKDSDLITAEETQDHPTADDAPVKLHLHEVAEACPSFREYFPESPRNWAGLVEVSDRMAPMIGIERAVLHEAQGAMGRESAAVTVLCLLERISSIRNPGGYLRRLTQLAKSGAYRADTAVQSLLRADKTGKLSADNSETASFTRV